jgi:hypothetical protein
VPVVSAAPVAPPSASAAPGASAPPAPIASAPPAAPSGDTGDVKTDNASPNHRIYVDGRVAGQTPDTVHVRCGAHTVRLGSGGKDQPVDVPCGGEVSVK